jgi:hypothetical protein
MPCFARGGPIGCVREVVESPVVVFKCAQWFENGSCCAAPDWTQSDACRYSAALRQHLLPMLEDFSRTAPDWTHSDAYKQNKRFIRSWMALWPERSALERTAAYIDAPGEIGCFGWGTDDTRRRGD